MDQEFVRTARLYRIIEIQVGLRSGEAEDLRSGGRRRRPHVAAEPDRGFLRA